MEELRKQFDAVFLGLGLGATPNLGIPGEEQILDGLEYIEESKMNGPGLKVGKNVVVIGAGNTAIDCATIAKRLGGGHVTMIYRRTAKEMTAYPHEYDFIKKEGVRFEFLAQPVRVVAKDGKVEGVACVRMNLGQKDASGRPAPRPVDGSQFVIPADQVVKAIGQEKPSLAKRLNLKTEKGYIAVDQQLQTSLPGVYAGGDCIRAIGSASTVMAVQDGKMAARAIQERLVGRG
jgi:glutamate synthase (NADPH/NADH) small chain